MLVDARTLASAPSDKGAYLLLLHLREETPFVRRHVPYFFPAGYYAYAGSAYGPGGIAARLKRHFRADKKPHWHIDQLSNAAIHKEALALSGQSECAIADIMGHLPGIHPALSGFGSSDCMRCHTHLFMMGNEGW